MSFGSSFGGFGSNNNNNNNNNQSSGFGGFGSSNTSFGQNQNQNQNTGFGGNNNTGGGFGGSGFGGNNNNTTNTSSGFGGNRFGTSNTGGGLFGSNNNASTSTSGFGGGFGASSTNNTSGGFGSNNNTGSTMFGNNNRTTFGGGSGNTLFGSGSNNSNTFGNNSNTTTSSGAGLFGSNNAGSTNPNDCPGTGGTPFQPFSEKENNSSTTSNYQSITFQQPYQKWSFEELRLADYNAGRRYGNGSGQAGAFGSTSFGGGFGNNQNQNQNQNQNSGGFGSGSGGGGLFGSQNQSNNTFGNNNQSGGFGSNNTTGGGLFGNKPAAGGLFGNSGNTTTNTGTGLFGNSGGGFGQQNNSNTLGNNTNTGGGLFGNQNNQQKPGFGFGQNNTTNTTGGGLFGQNQNQNQTQAGGGLFGNNQNQGQTNNLFGNNQQNNTSNMFGQQNQAQNQAGGFSGFGQNNQQKPAGLFGNNTANTGNSLFGNQQANQQQSAGLFGQNNQNAGSSLFGQKPAAGGSLFGQNNTNAAGGGLFGNQNQQNQQNAGSSLFGNQQQQKSLFGGTNTGGGLFGNNQQQNQNSGSLFGNQQNNQNQAGSSLFSQPQQQNNSLQAPNALTTSVNDPTPYGNSSIFNGLPPPPQASPGPIATPISAGQKTKKPAALPQYKINPSMSARLVTPQRRGYGFTYSTYGTPNSVSSVASSPGGMNNSLLGGSLGRNLGKSLSASNLRRTYDGEGGESVLSPGAFSANSSRFSGTGSLKKLHIDRSLRTDLFGNQAIAALPSPEKNDSNRSSSILKKKVSFDSATVGGNGNGVNGAQTNGTDSATPSAEEQGFLRSSRNGKTNGVSTPEKESSTGRELAIVHEDGSPDDGRTLVAVQDQNDPEPGAYWIKPSIAELKKMSKQQLKSVPDVVVGREKCGKCEFSRPVDLSNIDLDNIFDGLVVIDTRSLTVYPSDFKKPPPGLGLNVPSTISLENSWPRQTDRKSPLYEKSGPRFQRHVKRLAKVKDTEFVSYNPDTGVWVFKVEHFTTYGLDYDEIEDADDVLKSSVLSEAPPTPTPKSRASKTSSPAVLSQERVFSGGKTETTQASSAPEDTFGFRKSYPSFPGAFDDGDAFDQEMEEVGSDDQSFLGQRSAASDSDQEDRDEPSEHDTTGELEDNSVAIQDNDDVEMVGAFPGMEGQASFPKSILKSGAQAAMFDSPNKDVLEVKNDWADQLQKTISPRKQDRQALKESQMQYFKDIATRTEQSVKKAANVKDTHEINTSIDLMNSLFGKEEQRRVRAEVKKQAGQSGFEWPYSKSAPSDQPELKDSDVAFHNSFKPSWGPGGHLIYGSQDIERGEESELRFSKFKISPDINEQNYRRHRDQADVQVRKGVPFASAAQWPLNPEDQPERISPVHAREPLVWELASILFEDFEDEYSSGVPPEQRPELQARIRKDRLAAFWATICREDAITAVANASNHEERALAYLSMNGIAEACSTLADGKDFRLSVLVAQIGGDEVFSSSMQAQIEDWRKQNVLSEMSDAVRAIYELLAGNTCTATGKKGPIEDRAKTFVISERFGMGWKQAFGLKLWYALSADQPIEAAIEEFAADLRDSTTPKPLPWFLEGKERPQTWSDPRPDSREDVFWGLLRLFAATSNDDVEAPSLSQVLMPENLTGNPLQHRLSFELYHLLSPLVSPRARSDADADRLTLDFAAELDAAGQSVWALLALLRLSDDARRRAALQDTLNRSAPAIDAADASILATLVDTFRLPAAWLWEAKALQARFEGAAAQEARFLLRAHNFAEAHRVLCASVGPGAVVARDYAALRELLAGFGGGKRPDGWAKGAAVYEDFLKLLDLEGKEGEAVKKERAALLSKEMRALADAAEKERGFLSKVAIQEMSRVVGDMTLEDVDEAKEKAWVLQLPLTKATRRMKAMEMSLSYYQRVMAMGG